MNPPCCGYFSSFPFVCLQESVGAPGNRSPSLAGVLTRERPNSLLFRHYKSCIFISRTIMLPQSQGFTVAIPHTIKSCLAEFTSHEHRVSSFPTSCAVQKSWKGAAVKPFVFHLGHSLLCLPNKWAQSLGCWYSPASQGVPPLQCAGKAMHI